MLGFFVFTFNNVWRKKSKLDGEEFIHLFIFCSFVVTLVANDISWLMLCFLLLLLLFLWLLFFLRLIFLPSVVFCFHCGFVFLAHCLDKFRMTACNECRATTYTVVVRRHNQHLFRERKLFSHSTEGTRARYSWMNDRNKFWMDGTMKKYGKRKIEFILIKKIFLVCHHLLPKLNNFSASTRSWNN